jgi:hypothetical protein
MTNVTKHEYKSVIYSGCSVDSRGVSVCNLEDYLSTKIGVPKAKYQVWSDKHRFHGLFHTLDEAVDKFIELRNRG